MEIIKKFLKYAKLIFFILFLLCLVFVFLTDDFSHASVGVRYVKGLTPEELSKKYDLVAEERDDDGNILYQYYQRTPKTMFGSSFNVAAYIIMGDRAPYKIPFPEHNTEFGVSICRVKFEDNVAISSDILPSYCIAGNTIVKDMLSTEEGVEVSPDRIKQVKRGMSLAQVKEICGYAWSSARGSIDVGDELFNGVVYKLTDGRYAHIYIKALTENNVTTAYVDKIWYSDEERISGYKWALDEIFNPF